MANARTAHDPVCHDMIHPAAGYASAEHEGRVYYFCGNDCRDTFIRDPEVILRDEQRCEDARLAGDPEDAPAPNEAHRFVDIAVHPNRGELERWAGVLRGMGIEAMIRRSPADIGLSLRRLGGEFTVPWALAVPRTHARGAQRALRVRGLLID